MHGTTGHREPSRLHAQQDREANVGMRDFVTGRVNRDTSTELGRLPWRTLITSSRVRLEIVLEREVGIAPGQERVPKVCLAAHALVVPDEAMTHAKSLGRDAWS